MLPLYEKIVVNGTGKLWLVLGKLAFPVFLNHVLVIVLIATTFYDQIPLTPASMVCKLPKVPPSFGTLQQVTFLVVFSIISYLIGYVMHIFIEAPFANIIREVLEKRMMKTINSRKVSENMDNPGKEINSNDMKNMDRDSLHQEIRHRKSGEGIEEIKT